jgi:uncharacterized protein (TIGR00369 family)
MNPARVEQLLRLFHERAHISKTIGLTLSFNERGEAVVDLPYNPGLDHGLGGIHGGVYCTVIDTAGWFASAVTHELSVWVATGELSIHFLAPSKETALRAVGRVIKGGRRQDVGEVHLYDGDGKLVGHAVGTFVVLPGVSWE